MTTKSLVFALLTILVSYIGYQVGSPVVASTIWAEDYKELMFKCDQSMRDHYIAKRAVELDPTKILIRNLQSSELSLMDCHEYDKLRKRMIKWGLDANDLSYIGIEALEEQNYELRDFVEIHEIRY